MTKEEQEYVGNLKSFINMELDRISRTTNLIEFNDEARALSDNVELYISSHRSRIYGTKIKLPN